MLPCAATHQELPGSGPTARQERPKAHLLARHDTLALTGRVDGWVGYVGGVAWVGGIAWIAVYDMV